MQNSQPQFSVYDLFVNQGHVLDIFSEQRRMLALWCANIEKTIIQQELKVKDIYAGFQQLQFFLPVLNRYKKMTNYAENIWIFGVPSQDNPMPAIDGIHYIHLHPDDTLTQEWFLLVNHPTYSRSLSAYETSNPGTPHKDRTYKGILSSDPKVITPVFNAMTKQFTPVH